MKKIALKSLSVILIIMFLCTVVSGVADSLTVAKVTVEKASAKKIEHVVEAEGMVEKNQELAVVTEENLLVKTVYVSAGETVEENEVLAQVDLSQLEEVMHQIRNDVKVLQLQNAQIKKTEEAEQKSKEIMQKRANEDYSQVVQENTVALQKSRQELQEAKDALSAWEEAQKNTLDRNPDVEKNTEDLKKNAEFSKEEQEATSGSIDSETSENKQTKLQSLQEQVKNAQEAYDATVEAYQQALKEAERHKQDADSILVPKDVSTELNEITIEEKQKKLEKLEKIKQAEGNILSPVFGVVTQSFLSVGQKTSDTAAFTLADISSGMRFEAEIKKEEKKYVQAGDVVTLKVTTGTVSDLKIETIEKKQDSENFVVTVLLPPDKLSIGDSATMQVVKQSELYGTAVPYSAIHSEDNKDYVYVAEQEETILGKEYVVRAIEVEIMDKNERYAALSQTAVNMDAYIITDSDRYIEAGSRVRLQNQ